MKFYIQFKWSEWRNNNDGTKIDNGRRNKNSAEQQQQQQAAVSSSICDQSVVSFRIHMHMTHMILRTHSSSLEAHWQRVVAWLFGSFVWDCAVAVALKLIIQFHNLPGKFAQNSHRLFLIANRCEHCTGWVRATISSETVCWLRLLPSLSFAVP